MAEKFFELQEYERDAIDGYEWQTLAFFRTREAAEAARERWIEQSLKDEYARRVKWYDEALQRYKEDAALVSYGLRPTGSYRQPQKPKEPKRETVELDYRIIEREFSD